VTEQKIVFKNPFQPGAGHPPPYLAGREREKAEFSRLLTQDRVLENLVLTGLRGVGKTVLLNEYRPMALDAGWFWAGTDLSESATVSEETLATRLLTDLSVVISNFSAKKEAVAGVGFLSQIQQIDVPLDFKLLKQLYEETPGLVYDKIKRVLEFTWNACVKNVDKKGIVFAYDEAQNLADHAQREQYPLSILLDVFQSIQRQGIPFMLVLTGLPTLFPKLVEARTFSERMFHLIVLDKLNDADSRQAILVPIKQQHCPVVLDDQSVQTIVELSGGYPYFIQFICREVYDVFVQKASVGELASVPIVEILQKLDSDFFAGRWAKATDRQRELLTIAASIEPKSNEFTVQEVSDTSKKSTGKPFSPSHVGQMFNALIGAGLIYRNRYGKYSFAVPLLDRFISRQSQYSSGYEPFPRRH
jgi:AAA ATPase domain